VYSYDLAGHLTSVSRPNNTLRLMTYDDDGELTNIVEKTTTQFPICFYTINYNSAGRIQWEFKGPLPHSNAPPSRTMTYDNDNRLSTFNGTAVTIDNDGNLTSGPGTNNTFGTYTYDPRNELTSAGGLSYGYDPAGNRTSVTKGTNVTVYVIDPKTSQVLMRITGGVTNYYIYGVGLLYEIDATASSTTTAYYHFDCRGSTVALTDANGNPTDGIEYSSYGTTTYRFGTNNTPFLYNGQYGVQTDPNGLLFMRARYYNPYISRFINADPSGFGGGLNFYAFCNGNPISQTDPFGLCADGNNSGGLMQTYVNPFVDSLTSGYRSDLPPGLNSFYNISSTANAALSLPSTGIQSLESAYGVQGISTAIAPMAGEAALLNATAAETGLSGTALARQLGQAGEDAVGITGPKVGIQIPGSGITRFPDQLTSTTLTEVKNVQNLSFTQQLQDYSSYAQQNSLQFNLYVRPTTTLTGPLQNAVNSGQINLFFIPHP
jgi:RHS repeat-associated protein